MYVYVYIYIICMCVGVYVCMQFVLLDSTYPFLC